ncbi:hypothetical protein J4E08_02610 [Sagittula sp. NFXS13]|uniref:hypothetical protein n=1 Tax=Sagittula sp. NFXS13 TaxID=2819095 RepID=UPI0032DF735A
MEIYDNSGPILGTNSPSLFGVAIPVPRHVDSPTGGFLTYWPIVSWTFQFGDIFETMDFRPLFGRCRIGEA